MYNKTLQVICSTRCQNNKLQINSILCSLQAIIILNKTNKMLWGSSQWRTNTFKLKISYLIYNNNSSKTLWSLQLTNKNKIVTFKFQKTFLTSLTQVTILIIYSKSRIQTLIISSVILISLKQIKAIKEALVWIVNTVVILVDQVLTLMSYSVWTQTKSNQIKSIKQEATLQIPMDFYNRTSQIK